MKGSRCGSRTTGISSCRRTSVVRMDTRLHMYTSPLQEVVTAGSEPISVRTYAAWRIMDPVKFYKTTTGNDDRAKQIMGQKISGLVQAKLASHKLDEIFNLDDKKVHTNEIEADVAEEASTGRPIRLTGEMSAGFRIRVWRSCRSDFRASHSRRRTPSLCIAAWRRSVTSRRRCTAARATARRTRSSSKVTLMRRRSVPKQ